MTTPGFIETDLYGFFDSDFSCESRITARLEDLPAHMPSQDRIGKTRIRDARQLQERETKGTSFSEADFFEKYGFVLLAHESKVQNWDLDPTMPEVDQEAVRVYHPEADALIRSRLLPGRNIEVHQGAPARRGPGTPSPDYAAGVHQDYGPQPEDFQESLEAFATPDIARGWRQRFEQDDVIGFLVVDLWRPVYSKRPLRHMPLAICDPHTVRTEDCVPLSLLDFSPTGRPTNQLALRVHPDQRWYYYPRMTRSEVMAFKNFEFFKDDTNSEVRACFHSAFAEPGAPLDAEIRQSCEHRVSVFFLK